VSEESAFWRICFSKKGKRVNGFQRQATDSLALAFAAIDPRVKHSPLCLSVACTKKLATYDAWISCWAWRCRCRGCWLRPRCFREGGQRNVFVSPFYHSFAINCVRERSAAGERIEREKKQKPEKESRANKEEKEAQAASPVVLIWAQPSSFDTKAFDTLMDDMQCWLPYRPPYGIMYYIMHV
jgi:hypothetical protein